MLPRKAERSSFQLSSWMVSVQICECLRAHLIIPFRWFISSLFGFRVSVQLEYGSPSLSLSLSLSPVLDADSFHYVPIQKKTTHQWCTAFLFFFTFDFSLSRSRSQHFFPLSVLQLQTHTHKHLHRVHRVSFRYTLRLHTFYSRLVAREPEAQLTMLDIADVFVSI